MPQTPEYTKRANKAYYERTKHTAAHKSRNLANVLAFHQRKRILKAEAAAIMAIELA